MPLLVAHTNFWKSYVAAQIVKNTLESSHKDAPRECTQSRFNMEKRVVNNVQI